VTPLVPDHGKLMHLFLVRDGLDALAHLHPPPVDSSTFATPLPPLPAGFYRVYADITHESGFTQTLTDTIRVPAGRGRAPAADPDDSWWRGGATRNRLVDTLADGAVLTWQRDARPLVAGDDAPLVFTVREPDGAPAVLEPYMGMAAHAAVTRDDGSVFVHLHPLGTISWAAQQRFARHAADDAAPPALHAPGHRAGPGAATDSVSFPFAFPRPGTYHLWVQIKRHGRVWTGAFAADVGPRP
jgi:hypothetical protein